MRRDTPYRQVYRLWRELRQTPTLEVDSPLFHLPVADLPRLYECWCVLQVAGVLLDLSGIVVKSEQMFCWRGPAASFAATLALTEHTPLLTLAWQGAELRLRYQPRYQPAEASSPLLPVSLDRQRHIPDLALEWSRPDHPPMMLVLDAKYRLDASGGVPADALADAYTYLGALGLPDGTRLVQGVALLYPGTGAGEQYASGVSVLPLLPDAAAPLEQWLAGSLAALG
jgi:large subunit ribosomal protein MRP49